tara:strand:+ start:41 stop:685 length:645 start_codon:yes stop_codon:yes gene_type:complete
MNLINDDCMNIMPDYADDYFDLAIVDPPYGKKPMRNDNGTWGTPNTRKFNSNDDKWDIKPNKKYFDELFRVSKNQIIWGMNYFIDYLKPTNCVLVWDKDNGKNPFADCELAWTSFTTITKKYRFRWQGMLQENMNNKEKVIHPTQKPVALYRWLLENYAEPTDKILDTHLGSGSIAIACHYFGTEEFVGIEIDKEYFDMASERIEKQTMQIKLL